MRTERQRWVNENGGSEWRDVTRPKRRHDARAIGRQFDHSGNVVQPIWVLYRRPGQTFNLVRRRRGEQVVEFGERIGNPSIRGDCSGQARE